MRPTDWPRPPIRPEDSPKIRELLTAEEYAAQLKRLEVRSVTPAHERAPNAAGTLGVLSSHWLDASSAKGDTWDRGKQIPIVIVN